MDVEADVVPSDNRRLAGVHADADTHLDALRPGRRGQSALQIDSRSHRVGGRRKRAEEGVALGAHLRPAVRPDRLPERPAMRLEHVRITLAPQREQGRRTLDVGYYEGDSAD